jgi:hypothetical protein
VTGEDQVDALGGGVSQPAITVACLLAIVQASHSIEYSGGTGQVADSLLLIAAQHRRVSISVGKDRAHPAPRGAEWQTGRREPSRGLYFRGGQQPSNAIGVRDDMVDGRDTGEPGVCRHERLSSCRMGRCGQDRVERAEARSFLEQA